MTPDKKKAGKRMPGWGLLRFSFFCALVLGAIMTGLLVAVAYRFDITWELPIGHVFQVSERTRDILADTQGTVRISCFMDRRHPMFRPVSRLLRGFQEASRRVAGAALKIEYVDPHWDLTRAGRLASLKVPENALVFERHRRRVVVTLNDMLTRPSVLRVEESNGKDGGSKTAREWRPISSFSVFRGERVCATAIARLALPYDRSAVCWLKGHGEVRFNDYDALYGFSDIAREIIREGFDLKELALSGIKEIPEECHVLVIAGARKAFVPKELAMIETYLQRGGRLLCLLTPEAEETGLSGLLARWGIRVTPFVAVSRRTLTGDDVFCTDFSDHQITRDLANASVVFGRAVCLDALPNVTVGPDRPKVELLVMTGADGWGESTPAVFPRVFETGSDLKGPVAVAAVSEWGGNIAKDVAFKPTRLCVFGETDFIMNGVLASRANANRDLLLNALSWLAGVDTGTAPSVGGDAMLFTGLARREWIKLVALSAIGIPGGLLVLFCLVLKTGRRR